MATNSNLPTDVLNNIDLLSFPSVSVIPKVNGIVDVVSLEVMLYKRKLDYDFEITVVKGVLRTSKEKSFFKALTEGDSMRLLNSKKKYSSLGLPNPSKFILWSFSPWSGQKRFAANPGSRPYCTSGESSSESEPLTDKWEDQKATLTSISSSLKEGPVRENQWAELQRVGRELARDEIPDLRWVIKTAAEARRLENNDVDPADQLVQSTLAKLDVVQDITECLRDESGTSVLRAPRKRNAPGEGEARAAELNELLDNRIIPAVSEVITAYQELRISTANVDTDSTANTGADSTESEGDGPFGPFD